MKNIIDSRGKMYMSEFIYDLPENVMLNKVLTGCGGTTVALSNDIPYVVCVPFRSAIKNKLKWAKLHGLNICPVMGGITDEEILNYTGNKYMVTYDSLGRLTMMIDPSKFKILIDESHKLVDMGAFRGDAIRVVLENYKKYKSYVFMTATPIKDEYQLPALRDIPKVKIQWYNLEPVSIKRTQVKDRDTLNLTVAGIIKNHISNKDGFDSNAHIFINSVSSIIDIVETHSKISTSSPELINIICADNEENQDRITGALGHKYTIKNVGEVNKVNFYTATAFESSDIFDTTGMTYIVTDGNNDYTKNDVHTTLPQIIGRIRDTKHKNEAEVIFTSSPYYSNTTEKEFEAFVKEQLAQAEDTIRKYEEELNPMYKEATYNGIYTNRFILQGNNKLILNEYAWYNEMHSFDAINNQYYSFPNSTAGDTFAFSENDVIYNYVIKESPIIPENDRVLNGKRPNFAKLYKEYVDNIENLDLINKIADRFPEIKKSCDVLGTDKIRALKYRKKDIDFEVADKTKILKNDQRIVMLLGYKTGQFIASAEIKKSLINIYNKLGINKVAKATDINQWYKTEERNKWNPDTRRIDKGYVIMFCMIRILKP